MRLTFGGRLRWQPSRRNWCRNRRSPTPPPPPPPIRWMKTDGGGPPARNQMDPTKIRPLPSIQIKLEWDWSCAATESKQTSLPSCLAVVQRSSPAAGAKLRKSPTKRAEASYPRRRGTECLSRTTPTRCTRGNVPLRGRCGEGSRRSSSDVHRAVQRATSRFHRTKSVV